MPTTIYYFTGTGNSLSIARKLAAEISGSRIESIAELSASAAEPTEDTSGTDQRRIGFVFPTYAYGLPRIVEEFAAAVPIPKGSYLFAVASNCGIPGPVLKQLDKILRKRKRSLDAGFTVLDPSSSLVNDPDKDGIQQLMIAANRGEKPRSSEARIAEIAASVGRGETHPLERSNWRVNLLGSLLYPLAMGRFKSSGSDFHTGESCTGCGLCSRICPRGNIEIGEDGSPRWGEDCELCHACIQWCPKSAIQYKDLTKDRPRYRNPEVAVTDMLQR